MLAIASPASAYVRSRTGGGTAVAYDSACIFLGVDQSGSVDVSLADVETTVQKSMANWSVANSCSYIQLQYDGVESRDAAYDGRNVVQFLKDEWCHPATKKAAKHCYEPAAAAITTVFYLERKGEKYDGVIVDTDIEVNEVNFTFALLPSDKQARPLASNPNVKTSLADLENTLTHEVGHVMGLDHTCADSATAANAVDQNGVRPPACNKLATIDATSRAVITEATMFNSADSGETKKRSPEADDVAGICEAYPKSATQPTRCARVDLSKYTTGCELVALPPAGAPLWQLGALVAILALVGFRLRPQLGRARPHK